MGKFKNWVKGHMDVIVVGAVTGICTGVGAYIGWKAGHSAGVNNGLELGKHIYPARALVGAGVVTSEDILPEYTITGLGEPLNTNPDILIPQVDELVERLSNHNCDLDKIAMMLVAPHK